MTKPQRILYVINTLAAGGTERQLMYLLSNLDRRQFEPHVLTLYDETHIPYFYKTELQILNVPIHTLGHRSRLVGRVRALLRYVVLMWRLRPHLVQGCLHYANLIVRVCRPFCPPHVLLTSARAIYLAGELHSEARTYWLDNGLIINSPHIADQVTAHTHRPANQIIFIPNGIAIERFSDSLHPELRHELFPNADLVIGMIGRVARQKDHQTLIEALHLARTDMPENIGVYLLGDVGEPDVQMRMEALIANYQLGLMVCQIPATKDVAPYYHAADVIVLPSLYEGFPNVILEAFAAARPVIVSESADTLALVRPGETGWRFPTGDAPALAQCLCAVCRTLRTDLSRMGTNAQAIASAYSIPTMVSRYTELYTKLLS
jgi:glycosyltransferase involved in cell wall biosynthesis